MGIEISKQLRRLMKPRFGSFTRLVKLNPSLIKKKKGKHKLTTSAMKEGISPHSLQKCKQLYYELLHTN